MIASLPMYDRPALQEAHDRLWAALDLGIARSFPDDLWAHWHHPDLLFSQTCALPFAMGLYAHLTLIGAPDLRLPGCAAGEYNSVLLTRAEDTRSEIAEFGDAQVAYNQPHSQSGWGALYGYGTSRGVRFAHLIETGGHAASVDALLAGKIDLAAIDAHTFRLLSRENPDVAALRVFDRTPPQPATPYVTAFPDRATDLFEKLAAAIAGLSASDKETLGIHGIVATKADTYMRLPVPPEP